jgi:hypothetical protein
MGWIQLPSWCYPCGRRGAHWTSINFIVSIIKYLYTIFVTSSVWYTDFENYVNTRDLERSVFWDIMTCSPKSTDVSEENVASIFIAEK